MGAVTFFVLLLSGTSFIFPDQLPLYRALASARFNDAQAEQQLQPHKQQQPATDGTRLAEMVFDMGRNLLLGATLAQQQQQATLAQQQLNRMEVFTPPPTPAPLPMTVPPNNMVLSPTSVAAALTMVLQYSTGETQSQVAKFFALKQNKPLDVQKSIPEFYKLLERATAAGATKQQALPVVDCPGASFVYYDSEEEASDVPPTDVAKNPPVLDVANALFVHSTGNRNPGTAAVSQNYGSFALVRGLDFSKPEQARSVINAWVAKNTRNRITEIVSPDSINTATKMIIANTLYFRALWAHPFGKYPRMMPFFQHGKPGSSFFVKGMMQNRCYRYAFSKPLDAHIIELPYSYDAVKGETISPFGSGFNAYILKPTEASIKAVQRLAYLVNATTLDSLVTSMDIKQVNLLLPMFNITNTMSLKSTLLRFGVSALFDTTRHDMTVFGADKRESLGADDIVHKVFLGVDESGTEGAAATVLLMDRIAASVSLRVDGPFIFMVRHDPTKLTLFYGIVYDPRY